VHTVPLGNNDEAGAVKAERAAETAEGKVYEESRKRWQSLKWFRLLFLMLAERNTKLLQ